MSADELLEAARRGDQQAYRGLVEPHRRMLHAHCYRMLGSLHDAEDAMQDALLSAWQAIAGFEGRSSLRTWLFTIATHACLHLVAKRPRRLLPTEYGGAANPRADIPPPVEEAIWMDPYPDDGVEADLLTPEARYRERESVEVAFVAALQHLPASQRAVLILRDVLGFSAEETAQALSTSVASANSALQRARETLEARLPAESQDAARRALGEERHRDLVERFIGAWTRADVDGIVSLLAEDASFSMPPLPCWFSGLEDIRIFMAERVFQLKWRFVLAHASGQPAIAAYQWIAETGTYRFDVLNVLSVRGDKIGAITAFLRHDVAPFGLPAELPA